MIALKVLLAIVGLGIIAGAVTCVFTGMADIFGLFFGIISAAIVFGIFRIDAVHAFLGLDDLIIDYIALGTFVGGGILSHFELEKLGGAMILSGWVAVGLILLQVVPVSSISSFVQVAAMPFIIACIPIFLIILAFKM